MRKEMLVSETQAMSKPFRVLNKDGLRFILNSRQALGVKPFNQLRQCEHANTSDIPSYTQQKNTAEGHPYLFSPLRFMKGFDTCTAYEIL